MRPLTRDDYLLITIVVAAAIIGMCAFLVATYKMLEEFRERAARLLNGLYLQSGLIVSRSHPDAVRDTWF